MQKAEYIVSTDGRIAPNGAGLVLELAISEAMAAKSQFDATYVGALLANIFFKNPWLAGFKLSLTVGYEQDDEGRSYRCVDTSVDDVLEVPGIEQPDFSEYRGLFGSDAQNHLEEMLEDGHLLLACLDPDASDFDIELVCERSAIAELLLTQPISGAEAFAKMFPDRAAILGIGGDRGH